MARKKKINCPVTRYEIINMGNQWEPDRELHKSEHGTWVRWEDIAPYVKEAKLAHRPT